jgi:hypothetical protein
MLPVEQRPGCVLTDDTHAELVLALVELLLNAAAHLDYGGDDESETHR